MNRRDFVYFKNSQGPARINARNFSPGTLLFGYTCDGASFHVYKGPDGLIHRFVYHATDSHVETVTHEGAVFWDADQLVPDKRVYPESTSLIMATALRGRSVDIPFTTFDDARYDRVKDAVYHGRLKEPQ